jgi:hypothetical protein
MKYLKKYESVRVPERLMLTQEDLDEIEDIFVPVADDWNLRHNKPFSSSYDGVVSSFPDFGSSPEIFRGDYSIWKEYDDTYRLTIRIPFFKKDETFYKFEKSLSVFKKRLSSKGYGCYSGWALGKRDYTHSILGRSKATPIRKWDLHISKESPSN